MPAKKTKSRVQKTKNAGTMTDAAFRAWIISAVRKKTLFWKPRNLCLKNSVRGKRINPNTGRLCNVCECNICHGHWFQSEMQVDHILPIVPSTGWDSWDGYFSRAFCEVDGLQALCPVCHAQKTKSEVGERSENRKIKTADDIFQEAKNACVSE